MIFPFSDRKKRWEKSTNPYRLSLLQINTLTSVKPCAFPTADILITFTGTVLDYSELQSHSNTILPSVSCFTEIKAPDFLFQQAPYQDISEHPHLFSFPSISKESLSFKAKRSREEGRGSRFVERGGSLNLLYHIYPPEKLVLSIFL